MSQENPLKRRIYSVSEFSAELAREVAGRYPSICVRGEVTNLSKPRSGHWYFALKDETSQLRAVMFRSSNIRAPQIKEGDEIIACGKPGIYRDRGDLQLQVSHIQAAGEGELQRQFELLKKALLEASYFAQEKKKPIPLYPNKIAIISSPTGAVVYDIQTVANRRAPSLPLLLIPAQVQGQEAVSSLCDALRVADMRPDIDLILLARGGGSLEDFQAFNSREIADALRDCETAVISSVGHESDISIADLVADKRAATPSEAAEIATSGFYELPEKLGFLQAQLKRFFEQKITRNSADMLRISGKLINPLERLSSAAQKLDFMESLLTSRLDNKQRALQQRLSKLVAPLSTRNLENKLVSKKQLTEQLEKRLESASEKIYQAKCSKLLTAVRLLDSVNPLGVLTRGYSISSDAQGKVIGSVEDTAINKILITQLSDGQLISTINEINRKDKKP